MVEVVAGGMQGLASLVWNALGYLDTIDREQQNLATVTHATSASVEHLRTEVQQLQADVASLQSNLTALVSLLGVIIPPWRTKEEVLVGDDMGMLFSGAEDLGLEVTFIPQQERNEHLHEEVLSIQPAAGTIVAKGSTVTVIIDTPS